MKNNPRNAERNYAIAKEARKKIRASTRFEPVTSLYIFYSRGLNILLSIEVLIFY